MSMPAPSISVNEFLGLRASGQRVTVVDVRTSGEVSSECLTGCIHIPLQELSAEKVKSALAEAGDMDGESIYLLCGSGMRATKAAAQLSGALNESLVIIEGGINAIRQANGSLVRGRSSIISLERQVRIAAGLLVVLGTVLGVLVAPLFYGLSAFVGAGLVFAGVTDSCGMGMLLARMPWNRTTT